MKNKDLTASFLYGFVASWFYFYNFIGIQRQNARKLLWRQDKQIRISFAILIVLAKDATVCQEATAGGKPPLPTSLSCRFAAQ